MAFHPSQSLLAKVASGVSTCLGTVEWRNHQTDQRERQKTFAVCALVVIFRFVSFCRRVRRAVAVPSRHFVLLSFVSDSSGEGSNNSNGGQ